MATRYTAANHHLAGDFHAPLDGNKRLFVTVMPSRLANSETLCRITEARTFSLASERTTPEPRHAQRVGAHSFALDLIVEGVAYG